MIKKEFGKNLMNNYFVGELCVSFSSDVYKEDATQEKINEMDKVDRLNYGGAIYLGKDLEYTENNRHYIRYLALFLKQDDKYICLNDEYLDFDNRGDYFKNLVPLKNCLPQIDYNIPSNIDERDAKILFDTLFKRVMSKNQISLYSKSSNIKFSSDDYYAGILSLRKGYMINNRYELVNLVDKYLLNMSGAKKINTNDNNSHYTDYLCLFLKREKQNLLNLNNNQIYNIGVTEDIDTELMPYDSFYSEIYQYNHFIDAIGSRKKLPSESSVRKALTNFNKIK